MRTRRIWIALASATLALGAVACEVDTDAEDPAEMEPVEEDPGDLNGDPADAEGDSPATDPQQDDDPGSERTDDED